MQLIMLTYHCFVYVGSTEALKLQLQNFSCCVLHTTAFGTGSAGKLTFAFRRLLRRNNKLHFVILFRLPRRSRRRNDTSIAN